MKKETNDTNKKEGIVEPEIVHLPKLTMQSDGRIIVDPFGSWTGVPVDDYYEKPIQDVDDL